MRPLKWPENIIIQQMEPLNLDPGVQSNLAINKIPKVPTMPTIVETKVDAPCNNRSFTNLKMEERQRNRLNSESDIGRLRLRKGSETGSVRASRGEIDRKVPILIRKDIFYSGSVQNLKEFQSQRSLTAYRNSVISLNRDKESNVAVQSNIVVVDDVDAQGCSSILGSLLDVSLFKDSTFMLLAISNLFGERTFFLLKH